MFPDLPSFQFIMSIVFNIATVTFQFLGVAFGERIPLTIRMMLTFIPFVIVMVLMPFVYLFAPSQDAKLGIVLFLVFIAGMSTAVGFNCVMGLASQFPGRYVAAVMLGQGVAGIIVGAIRIVTKAGYGDSDEGTRTSTLLYFLLAAFVELLCIVGYFVLIRTEFAKFHMAKASKSRSSEIVEISEDEFDKSAPLTKDSEPLLNTEGTALKASAKTVLKKIWVQGYSVWSVFFVTLSLFPGMTSIIQSRATDFPNKFQDDPTLGAWFGICNIFLFQVFDFVGRTLAGYLVWIKPRFLWIFSTARVIFAVLFILCIIPIVPHPIFYSNWASFVIMIFFAFTNGYCGTLAMMFAPDCVEVHEKNIAGMMMSVFLQLGIFSAVLFALFILYLVSPCSLPSFLQTGHTVVECMVVNGTNTSACGAAASRVLEFVEL
jgi:MFS family permease